jgi:hypothetical protein
MSSQANVALALFNEVTFINTKFVPITEMEMAIR